ncbi:hypothetical protein T484DRAFT_1795168 [Baffinella frigidus]|nr:hypothetical protein T484DRAFT_1795168 [Cryptophyta sp. CCMP2293]
MERRDQADASKLNFTLFQSDHLAVLNAYSQYDSMRNDERYSFARERFLGIKTLQQIGQLKRQLLESLSHAGIVPPGLRAGGIEAAGRRDGSDGVRSSIKQQGRPSTERPAPACPVFAPVHATLEST